MLRVDNAIGWMNLYAVGSAPHFSLLSAGMQFSIGWHYHLFKQLSF